MSDSKLRLWIRRHRKYRQCESSADTDYGVSYPCTRPRWHIRYDGLHFNVFHQLAWQQKMVEVDYPETNIAVDKIKRDQGRSNEPGS